MRVAAALLAAALLATPLSAGCGGDGAEPGAPTEATLVLDFTPNAVHAGIYTALRRGFYAKEGLELEVVEPSASTDAPKLLEAGRADFAILDIHDLALARERGFDVVGIAAIVQRPLAAVIAADRDAVRIPGDLSGGEVGVTGLPSDEAVLDSVLESGGADAGSVRRVTIGFDAVRVLAAGRLDAATAFWNAEGVALRRLGVPTREFRVEDYGAPRYPELVLATSADHLDDDPETARAVAEATARGYAETIADPHGSLEDLLASVDGLNANEQRAQLEALVRARALEPPGRLNPGALRAWAGWDAEHGIVDAPPAVGEAFDLSLLAG
jgi:putative hydroxymethylpyrimidine transport system substrate-binding protein